jgi:hypothetical protein
MHADAAGRLICGGAVAVALALCALACGGSQESSETAAGPTRPLTFPRASQSRATLWAVGDGADGGSVAKQVARRIARARPERFLYLGDVYESGSAADFRDHYATVYGGLARITAPTPGNHDWPARAEGYQPYWKAIHSTAPSWYQLRIAGWRILSLNSEAPHDPGSAQVKWLERTLDHGSGNCVLAFWHRPLQSAGLHGDAPDVAPLWRPLRSRARIVLNGHDHDMERLRPRDGIVEYVAGAGGHGLYPIDSSDRRLVFADDQHYGALRIALSRRAAVLSFVAVDGTVLDRSKVTCRP